MVRSLCYSLHYVHENWGHLMNFNLVLNVQNYLCISYHLDCLWVQLYKVKGEHLIGAVCRLTLTSRDHVTGSRDLSGSRDF